MKELSHDRFKIKEFTIDCLKMTIENKDESVKLPVKVFEFLKLFLLNENRTVGRAQAIEIIWDGNEGVGKRGYVNAMWQIRKTFTDLGANCDELFVTRPKVGYFLAIAPQGLGAENKKASEHPVQIPDNKRSAQFYLLLTITILIIISISIYFYLLNTSLNKENINSPPSYLPLKSQTNYQGIEEQPAVSHDGNYLAFSWTQENKLSKIYVKDLKNADTPLKLISSGNFDEVSPTWSQDDKSLAYIRIDKDLCEVRVKHLASNEDRLIDTGCSYSSFWNILDWSTDGLHLIYPKKNKDKVFIVKYSFTNNTVTQMSYPPTNSNDIMAIWSNNNQELAIIRNTQQQFKVLVLNEEGDESILVDNKNSITGFTWDHKENVIYTTYLQQGHYFIYKIDVATKEKTQVRSIKGGSNLSFNHATNELFLSQHLLNEYIIQHSLIDQRIIRRVSSSSRDMYGEYIPKTADVIFTSNRSNNWDLWLKSNKGSQNLTKGIGAIATSSVSPNSDFFAVTIIKEGQPQQLFLGSLPDGKITHIDTQELTPLFPSWSANGNLIYFSAQANDKAGIYQYDINTKQIEQLTDSDEARAIEGNNGDLYVTRSLQDGIWKLDSKTKSFTKIISDIAAVDLASYFWQNDTIYYVSRTKENDLVKKYSADGDNEVVVTYPKNSIRKYKGISKADHQSFIITLKGSYDADIYSTKVK
ncbi:hypothetical protein AADZ86_16675 [Colwelliaceae bacterium BS250]